MNFSSTFYPPVPIKKGQVLQERGAYNSDVYYVEEGLLRSYSIDEKGKEHVFMFGPKGWIVGDTVAIDEPCDLYIDALEDSIVKVVDKEAAIFKSNEHNSLFKRINILQKRIILLMSAPAKERYHYFMTTYPNINQRVPQKMIASYLGLTPETLSKIKKELLYKKKDSFLNLD